MVLTVMGCFTAVFLLNIDGGVIVLSTYVVSLHCFGNNRDLRPVQSGSKATLYVLSMPTNLACWLIYWVFLWLLISPQIASETERQGQYHRCLYLKYGHVVDVVDGERY